MFKLLDGREHLWQWDLDRQIAVSDSTVTEVHFCNKTDDCSLVVEVVDGIANIPNILLQQPFDIRVYAYCACYTKVEATFKVKARTQPSDYVYTETDVVRWDTIADNAEKAVTEAQAASTLATNTANDLYEYVEGHQLQFTDDDAGNVTLQGVQTEGTSGNVNLINNATVGQTIIAEEVDDTGKPTKWKAVDYQERTHWSEIVEGDILPITEFTSVYEESMGINMALLPLCELEVGKTYTVIYDDVTYTCVAKTGDMGGTPYVGVGNDMYFGGEQTDEPFGVAYIEIASITAVIPLVEGTHTVRIIGEIPVTHKIPREYLYSKTIDFEWGNQDAENYWLVYTDSNFYVGDIIKEVKSGVMYYARITAPASVTGLDYDLPLVMPLTSYNESAPFGGSTGYKAEFECTAEMKLQFTLDILYVPGLFNAGGIYLKTLVNTKTLDTTINNLKVLPTVTAEDNGSFLCVVDGNWATTQISNAEEGSY